MFPMPLSHRLALTLFIVPALVTRAQDLPAEMYFSPDGHMLHTGGMPSTGFYEKGTIRTLDLTFAQPGYWTQLIQNYASGTDLLATLTADGVTYDSIGVRFKGQTSYSMLPANAQKRSFNITLDHTIADQHIGGYETLNLNNAFQDASFLREVVYLDLIRDHVPAAKANFVHLNINGESWGVYPNVQQLNSQFLKEWYFSNNGSLWRADNSDGMGPGPGGPGGMWGDGTAALNDLGPDSADYQEYYTLKRTEQQFPWADLVRTCQKLNGLPAAQLEDSLGKYMDLDRTLWFLATEIAFSDDDSYVYKGKMDYYLYWDEETSRMTPLEFDGNSVMKSNTATWSPFYHADNANYPLLNRLLAVPRLRQRYLAHLRTIIAEKMQSVDFNPLLESWSTLIDAEVQADPKKLYTYAAFNTELNVLRNFITNRRNNLNANSEVAQTGPSISNAEHSVNGTIWAEPLATEGVDVRATVASGTGIAAVTLYYGNGLYGGFQRMPMYDDGAHNDGAAGDGVYGAQVPAAPAMTYVRYYIEATANNAAQSVSYDPPGAEHDVYVYQVQFDQANDPPVRINELMAQNTSTVMDEDLAYEDWIEFHNMSGQAVDLTGGWLSDDATDPQKWQFPGGSIITAGGYMTIWADDQTNQGSGHAAFKLSAAGEEVLLTGPDGLLWDHVVFGAQQADMGYARIPNGYGPFVIQAPTFNANNEGGTGIADRHGATAIDLFPNPVRGILTVRTTDPQDILIHDATGRTIWSSQVTGTAMIDTGAWGNGTYFVRHGNGVEKLVVVR